MMEVINIETNDDIYDCDDCGTDYAEAGSVRIDNELIIDIEASAHCYNGINYDPAELLVMALKKVGVTVLVDGNPYHVTRHNEDYHGPLE